MDTLEARAVFRAQYRILDGVEIRHCEYGEWLVLNKPPESVVIPMIAFIEGGMELPMRWVTKDYLINYRLTPTQCSPNVFRVLGCNFFLPCCCFCFVLFCFVFIYLFLLMIPTISFRRRIPHHPC